MIGETDIYGVFIPSLLILVMGSLLLTAGLRRLLRWLGFYHLVWHRPLFDMALLIIVLGSVVALSVRWRAL
jgi:hypothetical protein